MVVLSATANGQMLPPTIIFRGKTNQTVSNLSIPPSFTVKTQKKTWMDDDLMKVWVEEIGVKHTQTGYKRLGFQNSMVSFDPFTAHLTDGLKNE